MASDCIIFFFHFGLFISFSIEHKKKKCSHKHKSSTAMRLYLPTAEYFNNFDFNEILERMDQYVTPCSVTMAVSTIILISACLFIYDLLTAKTESPAIGKYAQYADEDNDDPKDTTYNPIEESDSDSESEEPTNLRRSTRLRAKKKALKKATRGKTNNKKKSK
eukprot:920788_1